MEKKKFYWLKLKKDFFKRHDIRIIEGMPNGTDICLFYLKLMLESIDHDGRLRFSDTIPYTPEMLSVITCTELDIVEQGIDALGGLGMLEQTDDGTFILPKVSSMIDSASDTDAARRMRRLRENNANEQNVRISEQNVQKSEQKRTKRYESKSIEIEKELEIKRNIKEKTPTRFIPPSLEEVKAYCKERENRVDPERFIAFYTSNGWKVGKNPMKNWKAAVINWEKNNFNDSKNGKRRSGWRTGAEAGIVSTSEENTDSTSGSIPDDVLNMFEKE